MKAWAAMSNLRLSWPGMVGSMTTAVMSQLLLVASGVVVARALGPEDRGVLALVFVLSALSTQIGSLGVPAAVTYWTAKGVNPRGLLRALNEFRGLQYGAALALHVGLIFVVFAPRSPSDVLWIALLSLVATAAALSLMYGLAVLQGLRGFRAFNALRILNPTLYMVGAVGLWTADRATLTSIALVIIGASVLAAATTWVVVLRRTATAPVDEPISTGRLVAFGARSLAGSAPPLETFRLDQLLVGLVLSPVALGYYIVAHAFTNLTRFIGQSIGMITYPRVAAATTRSQVRIIRRDFMLGVAASGSLTLALIGAVPWLLPFFFGSEFAPARATAQILLVAAFFASVRRVLVDGTRGLGSPMWGGWAELLTLVALPGGVVVGAYTESLAMVAAVIAVANLMALLAVVPAIFGSAFSRRASLDGSAATAARHPPVPPARAAAGAR